MCWRSLLALILHMKAPTARNVQWRIRRAKDRSGGERNAADRSATMAPAAEGVRRKVIGDG